jgi:uncharacterized repeat protein (TIGR01451 family)
MTSIMKKSILTSIWIFILVVSGLQAQTNNYWNKVNGPDGMCFQDGWRYIYNNVRVTSTGRIYAWNQYYNIYRSFDNGVHWSKFDNPIVDSSAFVSEPLIIGQSGQFYKVIQLTAFDPPSLYWSGDEGATWELRYSNVPVHNIFESADGTLFGNSSTDVYSSSDGGASWHVIHSGGDLTTADYFIQFGNGTILLPFANLFSFNGGVNWTKIDLNMAKFSYCTGSGTIFTSTDQANQIRRTTDQGNTWTYTNFTNNKPESFVASSMMEINGHLLLLIQNDLYSSNDDGLTWQLIPISGLKPYFFCTISPLPNGDLLGEGGPAIIRSSDGGAHWSLSSAGLHQPNLRQLVTLNDSVQFAVSSIGLWKTVNKGVNWTIVKVDSAGYILTGDFNSPYYPYQPFVLIDENKFALVSRDFKHLWRTLNGGISFEDKAPADSIANLTLFKNDPGSRIFCSTQTGIQYSDDVGDSWNMCAPNLSLKALANLPSGKLFAMTGKSFNDRSIWYSTDNGSSWKRNNTLQVDTTQILALNCSKQGNIYVIYREGFRTKMANSNDEGQTWTKIYLPDFASPIQRNFLINSAGHMFISVASGGIINSTDQGQSWYQIPLPYTDPKYPNYLGYYFLSTDGYLYLTPYEGGLYKSNKSTLFGAYVIGSVKKDADGDCSTPDAQFPLHNWVISAEGTNDYVISTGENGQYQLFLDTGSYILKLHIPQATWWGGCDSVHTVNLNTPAQTETANFTVKASSECPLMSVGVSIPRLRRCFDNPVYLQYCNVGTETADSAYVDVKLDPYLTLTQCLLPHVALASDSFRVFLGTVLSTDCGQFSIEVYVNCDSTIIGQTHCITAHAFPDSLCTTLNNWSGANIEARVVCQDTVVQVQLKNTGPVTSQQLQYIIIEDDVVLFQGQKTYNSGEDFHLNFPANGHTWRVESMQEPGHPFSKRAIGFEEGCGGFVTLGYINQFAVNGSEPSRNTACRQNSSSNDPNDKEGLPLGTTAEHNIPGGQAINYLIRFQNTGTDTAFTVIVRDTLSALLNAATVQPGAASRPYKWNLRGEGILSFTFDNINLPDSTTNLEGSQGFISFTVQQKPGLTEGQKIYNKAGIYFDFNAPVITNETWHTIASPIPVGVETPHTASVKSTVQAFPNPMGAYTVISRTDNRAFSNNRLIVTDVMGAIVLESKLDGPPVRLLRQDLPAGVYYYRVENADKGLVGSGKLIME